MTIRPQLDRILVQRLEEGDQQIGGMVIPDTAKENPQRGKVRAVGNGKVNDDGKRVPLDVRVGDRILSGKYAGQDITFDGEEYLIIKEEDVLAVLEGTPKKKRTSVGVKGKTEKTRVGLRGKTKKKIRTDQKEDQDEDALTRERRWRRETNRRARHQSVARVGAQ